MGHSEIARLREQIILEYQATQRVFTDFTPTAKHEYVTKRQENIGICFQELKSILPEGEAIAIVAEALESAQSFCSPSGNTS